MNTKKYLTSLAIVMLFPLLACADWASDMFKDTSHNFGMVARGADTRFSFVFTNKYQEDVVIESVRSTCHCTQPSYQKQVIKTWETGQIDIQIDTRNFTGRKDATVTVRFSKPFPAEVQLHSFCLIRTDVYVEPGVVAFGTVQQGQQRVQKFRVNYAGQTYWQTWAIQDIQSESAFYKASVVQVQRDYNNVSYDVTLTLKENAPEGYLNDHIDIVSNDPNPDNQHCPVPVSGYIIPSVTVKPSPLAFGNVTKGQNVTKTVILSGSQPFSVTGFAPDKANISAQISKETKTVHIIPVTIKHDGVGGKVTGTIGFQVSSQSAPVKLIYSADLHQSANITKLPRTIIPADQTPVTQTPASTNQTPVQTADDVPENSAVQTPATKTPAVETPAVETPAVETPAVETPAVETPVVETPVVETPAVETPAVETPAVEEPAVTVGTPTTDAPVVEEPAKPLTPAQQYFPPKKDEETNAPADAEPVVKEAAPATPEVEKKEEPAPEADNALPSPPVDESAKDVPSATPVPEANDALPPPPVDEAVPNGTPEIKNDGNNPVKDEQLPQEELELPALPMLE